MKIALIGYMGSGKTFWARELARNMDYHFQDLDQILETEYLGTTISDFIQEKGEIRFRKEERIALLELGESKKNVVLATGGGTPCYYENMETLNESYFTIYLNPSIQTLATRLNKEKEQRPLLQHVKDGDLQEFIAKHLFERRHYYMQANAFLNEDHLNLESLKAVIKSKVG